ncbi:tetratricopeptide repeat protein [Mangrovibacterium sp.]|uniref:tetratricopeptide repeat protein n=1 Tax=Mangrovibacterium sp. TaxID=1961364 RepID=UPI00356A7881
MKSFLIKTNVLTFILALVLSISAIAQKEITGTVYREGKPAAGITVEAHKSSKTFMTSFDGKYKVTIDPNKSKYIKFTFIDESKKLELTGSEGDVIDFSFDGSEIPGQGDGAAEVGVDTRTSQELVKDNNTEFMSQFTLYDQFYKQRDYKSAYPHWIKVYRKYPKSSINIYHHGINMYSNKVESAADQATKDAYIDTLMSIYDRRIKYFDQKGFVLGRKATDFVKYKLGNPDISESDRKAVLKKSYAELEQAVKLEGNESEAAVMVIFMQVTKSLFLLGELDKEQVVANYGVLSQITDAQLAKAADDERATVAKNEIDKAFQTSGAADCDALVSYYEPKFDEIASNVDDLKKMLRALGRQDCTSSELFAKASEKLYDLEPSAEAAFNMARLFVKRDEFDRAKEYYQNAIASETDKELLAKYYYELGIFTFIKERAFAKARDFARKSLENDPNSGKTLILLGDIYAQGAKTYGENDFDHTAVYWLAVDYYQKAKRVDPDVTVSANEKIATYRVYFPNKESLFFEGLQDGQAFKLGGWINETTTIRAK